MTKKQFEFTVMWNWWVELNQLYLRNGTLSDYNRRNLVNVLQWAREEGLQSIIGPIQEILDQTRPRSQQAQTTIVKKKEKRINRQRFIAPLRHFPRLRMPRITCLQSVVSVLTQRGASADERCFISIMEELPSSTDDPWVRMYIVRPGDDLETLSRTGKLVYKYFGPDGSGKTVISSAGTSVDGSIVSDTRNRSQIFINFGRPIRALRFYEDKVATQPTLEWIISSCLVRRSVVLEIMISSIHEHERNKKKGVALNVDFNQAPNQFGVPNTQALRLQRAIRPGSFNRHEDMNRLRDFFGMSRHFICFRFEATCNHHNTKFKKSSYRYLTELYCLKLQTLHSMLCGLFKLFTTEVEVLKSREREMIDLNLVCCGRLLLTSFGYNSLHVSNRRELEEIFHQVSIYLSYYRLGTLMQQIYSPEDFRIAQEKSQRFLNRQKAKVQAIKSYTGFINQLQKLALQCLIDFGTHTVQLSEFKMMLQQAAKKYLKLAAVISDL